MNKPLYRFFADDHRRIEALLDKATEDMNHIQMDYYHQFRTGLLTHIKMEEKILFPAAQMANGNVPVPMAAQLRLEHSAITSLMAPPPNPELVKVLRYLLEQHDLMEEKPDGMYEICEALTHEQTQELLTQLAQVTEVPVLKHNPAGYALDAAKRALARAGYDYDAIVKG